MKKINKPLVSIIIVCYNHEKFIEEAVESVFNQTYKELELAVVDNDSKDDSSRVIENLQKIYSFSFIKQENIGVPRTLNKYIPECKGKYLSFFSADDYLHPQKIEKQAQFMELNPQFGMCYGRTIFVDQDSNELRKNNNRHFRSGSLFNDIITFKFHPPAPTYLFRREVFDNIGLYNESLSYIEDVYMLLKVAKHYQIGFIDEYLAYQRQHSHNLSRTVHFEEQDKEGFLIFEEYRYLKNYNYLIKNLRLQIFASYSALDPKTTLKYKLKYMFLSVPLFYRRKYIKSLLRTLISFFKNG